MRGVDLSHNIQILRTGDLPADFEGEWADLFTRCFSKSEDEARKIFGKYRRSEARICVLRKNGRLCASYAGLILDYAGHKVFLSTDTMSDGSERGGSVLLGEHLYAALRTERVMVVCGYPNARIRGLRETKLGWTLQGGMSLYIGIPVLWRLLRRRVPSSVRPLWQLERPDSGFYGKDRIGLRPLGRTRLYGNGPGAVFTLSANSPGAFFIKLPESLIHRRTFGYRFLHEDPEFKDLFLQAIAELDLETIDVP